jgi:14-3-3 protein beta/theta/zeta
MTTLMKKVVESGAELSSDDRNLLSVAYKNVVGSRRTGWRIINSLEQKVSDSEQKQRVAKEFREKIEKELRGICNEVLGLIDKYLLVKADQPESKVFYLKMKGDYNRYLAEIEKGSERVGKQFLLLIYKLFQLSLRSRSNPTMMP